MNDFESVAKQFHRKAPLTVAQKDADFSKKDKEQAKQRLKEETKGETLGEWFNKKQKEVDADLISQDEWSEEARKAAAEARQKGGSKPKPSIEHPLSREEYEKKRSEWDKKNGPPPKGNKESTKYFQKMRNELGPAPR